MAVFDITHLILGSPDIYDRNHRNKFKHVKEWLAKNVGEYYGRGEDPITDVGSGWEIFVLQNGKLERARDDEDVCITWNVDITDEDKSVLFALKWL